MMKHLPYPITQDPRLQYSTHDRFGLAIWPPVLHTRPALTSDLLGGWLDLRLLQHVVEVSVRLAKMLSGLAIAASSSHVLLLHPMSGTWTLRELLLILVPCLTVEPIAC